jgi:hypothetical protein
MGSRRDQRAEPSIVFYAITMAVCVAFAHNGFYATCVVVGLVMPFLYIFVHDLPH